MNGEKPLNVEALGAKIRRLRQARSIAQDRLAIEAGIDQSGLSKFERGQQGRIGVSGLVRIARVLSISFDELVAQTDWSSTGDENPQNR